ncbi:MAG: class I SAM-dependent methyltransferase [Bacteroidota bacterium]
MDEGQQLEQERQEHNTLYGKQRDRLLEQSFAWQQFYNLVARPPHLGGTLYGQDHHLFLGRLREILANYPAGEARILDYGCGTGALGVALASLGYQVTGFDLSDEGIAVAQRLAAQQGLVAKTEFVVANAQALPFDDQSFDLVVGKAVLHHTIKYPGTAEELHRIMKPRACAVFLEGAASNPLIALARRFTIQEELGDVPLTIKRVQAFGQNFSEVKMDGYFFLYMLKRLGYYSSDETLPDRGQNSIGKTTLFRQFLRMALALDNALVNKKVLSLAGRYIIELWK